MRFTMERLCNECGQDTRVIAGIMNGLKLPYRDSSFDAVFLPQVLEGLPEPWMLVEEALRILRPGGRLGLSLRNTCSWFGFYFPRKIGKGQVTNFGPYRPVVMRKWRRKLCGMAKLKTEWGVSPAPWQIGQKVTGFMLSYSRLWVAVLVKQ